MSIQQIFKVTVKSSPRQAADDLGLRRPSKFAIARTYSVDINMSPHCEGFLECPVTQKRMIVDFLKNHLDLISHANIYAETRSFKYNKDHNRYDLYGHAKLHWHGTFTMYPETDKAKVVDTLIKKMRKRFSCQSATSTFRAVFFKEIKNGGHMNDRIRYQTKQVPLVIDPISFDNRILQKNI